jgi:uncharacterized protein (DUF1697 family)
MLELDMTIFVSMLRGVNLAGANRVSMDALRRLYESLGLRNSQTYVQSGNVVFNSEARDLVSLSKRIESGIELRFGFHAAVILRTESELRDVVARNPFVGRRGIEPSKLLAIFLAHRPEPDARERVLKIQSGPEEVHCDGRELYIYLPNGVGRSKFPWSRIDEIVKQPGTARNWNTVTKLLAIAEQLEDSR